MPMRRNLLNTLIAREGIVVIRAISKVVFKDLGVCAYYVFSEKGVCALYTTPYLFPHFPYTHPNH
jgi:hypothetical protein